VVQALSGTKGVVVQRRLLLVLDFGQTKGQISTNDGTGWDYEKIYLE
jgi:hypothetical protein